MIALNIMVFHRTNVTDDSTRFTPLEELEVMDIKLGDGCYDVIMKTKVLIVHDDKHFSYVKDGIFMDNKLVKYPLIDLDDHLANRMLAMRQSIHAESQILA